MSNPGEVGYFNLACNPRCAEAADWAALDAQMVAFCRRDATLNDRMLSGYAKMSEARNAGEFEGASEEELQDLDDLGNSVIKRSAAAQAYLLGAEQVRNAALAKPCSRLLRAMGCVPVL